MKFRFSIFFIFFLLMGAVGFYYFRYGTNVSKLAIPESAKSPKVPVRITEVYCPTTGEELSDEELSGRALSKDELRRRYKLHPLADPKARELYAKRTPKDWDDWTKASAKILTGSHVVSYGGTPEEIEAAYQEYYEMLKGQVVRHQKINTPLPKFPLGLPILDPPRFYEGPQTAEALMSEFNDRYSSSTRASEMDEFYPRERFLKRLLDKGAVVRDLSDYQHFMNLRRELLWRKERQEDWLSGNYGIPITTDFAEYEEGFLERKAWENSITQQVSDANPGRNVNVYFPSNHPDKYLPVIGKMRFVRLTENHSRMRSWGAKWTAEQSDNLLTKGIEPEGLEIVYLDENYNVIPKPPFIDEETRIYNSLETFDGIKVTPDNYERVVGRPPSVEWLENYDARQDIEKQEITPDTDALLREAARESESAAREAAKSEYEKFAGRMRQLESFSTMSDAEIEKQLERQFRKQFLPEHPVEQLEQITPERLERALGTLFKYGFEDGMRHIREDNATLADLLERHFGKRAKPPAQELKPPQRPAPPKPPSEPPASSTETQ